MAWYPCYKIGSGGSGGGGNIKSDAKVVTAGTSASTYNATSDGYDGYSKVTVNPTPTQTKSTTATTSTQYITPDSGYQLSQVTVNPQQHSDVNSGYYDVAAGSTRRCDLGSIHNLRYVDIRGTGGGITPSGTYDFGTYTTNGTQTPSTDISSYKYVKFTINVPMKATYDGWHTLWSGTAKNASTYPYSSSFPSSKSGYQICFRAYVTPEPDSGGTIVVGEEVYFYSSGNYVFGGLVDSDWWCRTIVISSSKFTLSACKKFGASTQNNDYMYLSDLEYAWVKNDF